MFCAISGKPPTKAVLSPNSKCIFEQTLIEQYIDQKGTDPISNDPLNKKDLIHINVTPQQFSLSESLNSATVANNYSIPSLLVTLQREWDAVMLENFELRKQLDTCKRSLSDALYRYDAVASTAAKAFVERDKLKQELTELSTSIDVEEKAKNIAGEHNVYDSETLLTNFVAEMTSKSQEYVSESRKAKKKLQHFGELLAIDTVNCGRTELLSPNHDPNLSLRSVVAKNGAKAFVFGKEDTVIDLEGESDYVVEYDNTLYSFNGTEMTCYDLGTKSVTMKDLIEGLEQPVVFMGFPHHILDSYLLIVTNSGNVYGYNKVDKALFTISTFQLNDGVEFTSYHKDGGLLCLGNRTEGVFVLNLLAPKTLPIKFPSPTNVAGVHFGLNGYWMFILGESEIQVYDLRKEPGTLAMQNVSFEIPVSSIELDDTGKGMIVNLKDSTLRWYEFVKGQSFVERTQLSTHFQTADCMALVRSEDGFLLKAVSENQCMTYKLQ